MRSWETSSEKQGIGVISRNVSWSQYDSYASIITIILLLLLLLDYENRECQKYFWNGSIVKKKVSGVRQQNYCMEVIISL